jgi:hypothetical protein
MRLPPRPPSSLLDLVECDERHHVIHLERPLGEGELELVESEQLPGSELGEQRVLRQTVAADAEARLAHVGVRRAHPDRIDRLEEVEAGRLREAAPLLHEGDGERPVAVLEHLRGLGGGGGSQPGERVLVHVHHR